MGETPDLVVSHLNLLNLVNYIASLNQNFLVFKMGIIATVSESCVRINEVVRVNSLD